MLRIDRGSNDINYPLKDKSTFKYPLTNLLLSNDTYYDLTSVCVHVGPNLKSGHYYGYIFDFNKKIWLKADDKSVTIAKKKNICTNDAIFLIYSIK